MARTSFYDDNRFRRYPFLSTDDTEVSTVDNTRVPDSVLLDCGFRFYAGSNFSDAARNVVWLDSVSWDGTHVTLSFATDALPAVWLVFTFAQAAQESQVAFGTVAYSGDDGICSDQLLWDGFAVLGSAADLIAWAGSPRELDVSAHILEPSCSQNMDKSYVRSISLANRRRVRTTDVPGAERPILVNSKCLQGPARFEEGVNCIIDYDTRRNGLIISGSVGAGAGQVCEELPVVSGESSPDGGNLLSGGPACTEIMKSINGLPGPNIIMRGTSGVIVERDADNAHQINISISPAFLAAQGGS